MPVEHDENWVSRQAENKIGGKLGLIAEKHCKSLIEAYNLCAKGRTLTVLWACRRPYNASQGCVHQYVNEENLELVKRRWIAAGRPRKPDWKQLFEGLDVPPKSS